MRKKICMVGTGYVGLVTGAGLAKLGHDVTCMDINVERIASLNNGEVPFFEKDLPELVDETVKSGNLHFTTSLPDAIRNTRYIIIAVATPQAEDGTPDLSQLYAAVDSLVEHANQSFCVVVKSTVPVGCFADLRKRIGDRPFEFVSCPEFLAEGTAVNDFFFPSRTIIGAKDERLAREVGSLFADLPGPRVYTTPEAAQIIKYASNSFLAARVAFINEVSRICEAFGVDVHAVSRGMLMDERFGNGYLFASIGYGGACLPKDLAALRYTARMANVSDMVLAAVAGQNTDQVQHTVDMICKLANVGEKVCIFGISFKDGTSDIRNSLSVQVIEALVSRGRRVAAHDPQAIKHGRQWLKQLNAEIVEDPMEAATKSSTQAFLTGWKEYRDIDLEALRKVVAHPRIFDGPGIFDPKRIRRFGFDYVGIGRVGDDCWIVIEND